jgi:hypothetical protein
MRLEEVEVFRKSKNYWGWIEKTRAKSTNHPSNLRNLSKWVRNR